KKTAAKKAEIKKRAAATTKAKPAKPAARPKAATPVKAKPAPKKPAAAGKTTAKAAPKTAKQPLAKKETKKKPATAKVSSKKETKPAPKKVIVPAPVILERPKKPMVQPRPPFQPVPTLAQTQAKKLAESKKEKPRFSKEDLLQFKKELLALRDQLMGRSGALRNAALQGTDDINPEEDGTDAFLRQQTLDQVKKQHELIANINTALRAIEDGTYGICCNCGELIRKQRLSYLPFAKHCITCQSELDRQNQNR
ncbi:MAG: TraR/DksA C4-type zinc finger protein, partial [Kiritimatiellae bacterium]|nr:TraR/DksA C4-type zinc finger protein [Kiritimatiellia bacterium]